MARLVIIVVAVVFATLFAFDAQAWMDDWAPAFNCTPAAAEKLSETNVSNFVSKVRFEDMDPYWQYCEGYKLDLNGDGIEDFVYTLPWMGCGLAACGYNAHFRVSAGANGWADTVIEGFNISKDDLVNVAGKTYFRHSYYCGNLEKSAHNHWIYQVFSFDKNGTMICSNGDFGKLFPAVTIYYINPKFKQIELTKKDLREIEDKTKSIVRQIQQSARATKEGFDLLNYRYLWNDDAEKARIIINPASKKKEADDWKAETKTYRG